MFGYAWLSCVFIKHCFFFSFQTFHLETLVCGLNQSQGDRNIKIAVSLDKGIDNWREKGSSENSKSSTLCKLSSKLEP